MSSTTAAERLWLLSQLNDSAQALLSMDEASRSGKEGRQLAERLRLGNEQRRALSFRSRSQAQAGAHKASQTHAPDMGIGSCEVQMESEQRASLIAAAGAYPPSFVDPTDTCAHHHQIHEDQSAFRVLRAAAVAIKCDGAL